MNTTNPTEKSRSTRHDDAPTTDHLQELAKIERLCRKDSQSTDTNVHVGDATVHITWTAWDRGELTAAVCAAIVRSAGWRLATVHDSHETDAGVVSFVTADHDPDSTEAER